MTRPRIARLAVAAALLAALALAVLALAPAAAAAESLNPWDRAEEPLEIGTGEFGTAAGTPQENAAASERCGDVLGLPANIGCRVVSGGLGGIGGLTNGVLPSVTGSAFDSFTEAVSDGAVWFLSKIAAFLDSSTRPAVTSPWFIARYDTMIALAGLVVLPLVLLAIVDAVVHGRPGQVLRTLLLYLPLAGIVSYVTLELVDLALVITDWMCAFISGGVAADSAAFLEGMGVVLTNTGGEQLPVFAVFIAGIFTVFGAFVLWIELILRDAGINLSVLFLPLAFATMVWPRIARWASRALRTLAALILSKVFIVAVISLGASMVSGATEGASLETVVTGVALLGLATFAPWVLWRLLAPVEGAMDSALEGATRHTSSAVARPQVSTVSGVGSQVGGKSGGPLPVAGVPLAAAGAAGGAAGTAMSSAGGAAGAARNRAGAPGGATAGGSAGIGVARAGAEATRRGAAATNGGAARGGRSGGQGVPAGSGAASGGSGGRGVPAGGYGPPVVTDQPYGPSRPAPAPPASSGVSSASAGPLPVGAADRPPPPRDSGRGR